MLIGGSSAALSRWPRDKPSAVKGRKWQWEGAAPLAAGMAPGAAGMVSPRGSPPPQPPNVLTWCEIVVSFREEQKGPAALSILLGWQLGHLEDNGSQAGLERVGPLLPTRSIVLHVHRGGGDRSCLPLPGGGIWGQSCLRTGSPCLCRGVEPLLPTQTPLSRGSEKGGSVQEGDCPACSPADSPLGRGFWWLAEVGDGGTFLSHVPSSLGPQRACEHGDSPC